MSHVSRCHLEAAARAAQRLLDADPLLHRRWLDQNRPLGNAPMIYLRHHYDWVPAFFAWYNDEPVQRTESE
jgi:hypothetical protein